MSYFEFDAESLVYHWRSFLLSEEDDLGHAGIFVDPGIYICGGDFDGVVVQKLGCLLHDILGGDFALHV